MAEVNTGKTIIVHPFLKYYGGAEAMLSVLAHSVFPESDIFTFAYDKAVLDQLGIVESRVKSPFRDTMWSKYYREMSLFYPSLIESELWEGYDNIISLSYAYVHGLISQPDQFHTSFILTPMRLLWLGEEDRFWANKYPVMRHFYQKVLSQQRLWDAAAANRPDQLVAISEEVQSRIKSFWGRDSQVIYPPVDVEFFRPKEQVKKKDYFITHARLVRHKRIDLMIQACIALKKKLIIIGEGPLFPELQELAGKSEYITFSGFLTDPDKRFLIQQAKGYLFASNEDFGISPVEAISAGTPVLAYRKGGALETVQAGVSGMFFDNQTIESITEGIVRFEKAIDAGKFSSKMSETTEKFSSKHFIASVQKLFTSTSKGL
ncbi:MAG: glycosyltransferase [Candidatus Dojkabacteria bacterium]|nr:MAG: glycosyltransferase [Candidatus Dojkabacteria bacterium]